MFSKKFLSAGICWLMFLLLSLNSMAQTDTTKKTTPLIELSLRKEIEHSIDIALKWLSENQKENGSWSDYPGITALVVTAFLQSPKEYDETKNESVAKGVKYILSCVHPTGGIYPEEEPQMRAYNTSICLMALVATKNRQYDEAIKKARDYLISLQADEDESIDSTNSIYGGIGYNRDERSDISNMQWALESLKLSEDYRDWSEGGTKLEYSNRAKKEVKEVSNKELFWDKAILFLQRCQNLKKYNDQAWAGNDGGFIYYPGNSKAGGTTSYGSMTYAGMKSFIYAGVKKDDPRVQAAYNWIRKNYTVEKNPELDKQGLFYYYQTMAKALAVYGEDVLVDTAGTKRNWREDLAKKLISIQDGDGFWVNSVGRWWENNKDLATAYCVLALEQILSEKTE